jgi:hypothetical protein
MDVLRAGAARQWEDQGVPPNQLLLWHLDSPSVVVSETEITALDPAEVVLGFEPLVPRKRRFLKALREQISAAPAVTMYVQRATDYAFTFLILLLLVLQSCRLFSATSLASALRYQLLQRRRSRQRSTKRSTMHLVHRWSPARLRLRLLLSWERLLLLSALRHRVCLPLHPAFNSNLWPSLPVLLSHRLNLRSLPQTLTQRNRTLSAAHSRSHPQALLVFCLPLSRQSVHHLTKKRTHQTRSFLTRSMTCSVRR